MAPLESPKTENSSILRDEERAFPRGGTNALTPLEYKQIQIQATKDVLFEERGLKDAADNAHLSTNDNIRGSKRRRIAEIGHTRSRYQKKRKYDVPSHGRAIISSLNYKVSSFQKRILI